MVQCVPFVSSTRPHGQAGSPMPPQGMQVPLDATHSVPLSVHVAFAQQGPDMLPQALQLPAWQSVAALPASGASHCPPSATHTPLPGWV